MSETDRPRSTSLTFGLENSRVFESSHVITLPVENNQISSIVTVAKTNFDLDEAGSGELAYQGIEQPFIAIWDTGASMSVVEPRVVNLLELDRVGFTELIGIDGNPTRRSVYNATIVISKHPVAPNNQDNLISLHQT